MIEAPAGLTTLGRCLIAAGVAAAACSVALDERDLLRIGAFVVALPLLAALLARHTRRSVRAERTLAPARVSVGDEVRAELAITGEGGLARVLGWLAGGRVVLTDAVPDALGHSPRLAVTVGGPRTEVGYPLTPLIRGLHQVGPLTARVGDPLGLAEYEREVAGRSALTVLPRVTPLRGLPAGLGRGEGDAGATGLRRGPGERDALVREYQPGDPLRTVHWRSTARRDELMVRLEERPWHGGATVLLDRRAQAHRGTGATASLEWAVELAASVCHHLISQGRRVTLIGEDGVPLASGRDPDALLDTLALLRPTAQPGLMPGASDDGELFAILGAVDPAGVAPLLQAWTGGHTHAVLLDTAAWGAPGPGGAPAGVAAASQVLTEAGWTVLVGAPSRTMDDVWDEFCRRLPVWLGSGH